jgi:uncharacterized protein (DUF2235 family)
MSKRIIYCCDGTWEKASSDTNVFKIYQALAQSAAQATFYDDGVGADGNPIEMLIGGALGTGLWAKVKQGYKTIAQSYQPGDQLFLLGFSRGAYTARSLAGMIAICGLPAQNVTADNIDGLTNTAFSAYREKDNRQNLLNSLASYALFNATLTMVGVWDTVGSLGIPALFGGVDPAFYGFLDTNLHPDVKNAYHGVAVDEKRAEFPATLWTGPFQPDQTVEQVYFSGVHGDVGGGETPQAGVLLPSDIPLSWMISKAAALGADFSANALAPYPSPIAPGYATAPLHESWEFYWGFPKRRTISADASIANSVALRAQGSASYRPSNLSFSNGTLAAAYAQVTVAAVAVGAGSAA